MSVLTNKKITWRVLQGLKNMRDTGSMPKSKTIENNPYVKNVLYRDSIIKNSLRNKNKIELVSSHRNRYNNLFDKLFKDVYENYYNFLSENELFFKSCNYTEFEIQKLIELKKDFDNNKIDNFVQKIIDKKINLEGVSAYLFKASKYIEKREPSSILERAVKKILNIDEIFYSSHQFINNLYCKSENPDFYILCENLYFLKYDFLADLYNIDLLYVGGNNTTALERLPSKSKPIYYVCDWDYHGLKIYERITQIDNCKNIKLLTPVGKSESIDETMKHHRSQWKKDDSNKFSFLNPDLYTEHQKEIIYKLIDDDKWIEEQKNDFDEMLKENNCI